MTLTRPFAFSLRVLTHAAILSALVAAGCSTDGGRTIVDDDSATESPTPEMPSPTPTPTPTPCIEIALETGGLMPEDGALDHGYRTPLQARFDTEALSASIELVNLDTGGAVSGQSNLAIDGMSVSFEMGVPLARSANFQATVRAEAESGCAELVESWNFGTSDLGTAVASPAGLVGRTYLMDMAAATFVKPAGIGALFNSFMTAPLFTHVTDVSSTVTLANASGPVFGNHPNYCVNTRALPPGSFNNPHFLIGPIPFVLPFDAVHVPVSDAYVSGDFSADGSVIGGFRITGLMDTRPLNALVGDIFCDLMPQMAGYLCESCPDGTDHCLELDVVGATGDSYVGQWTDIGVNQRENHLCGNCADSVDNDVDGAIDAAEPECDPGQWP
jgi:hypothetical protein